MMRQWKVWIGGAAGVMGLLMLIGCAATSSRESIGESSEDAAITAKVKSSFQADPLVSASAISVQTSQGIVHLSGTVNNEQERYRAIQLVQGVAGVREIIVRNLVVQR
jgi:hyperosmotically inducible protein